MSNNHEIMVDIETMGTNADAPILAIGAVKFNTYTGTIGEEFYERITLKSNVGRPIDPDTVEWWLRQSKEAQAALTRNPRTDLKTALGKFTTFCRGASTIWSNGPTFDEAILRDAMEQLGMQFPLKFYTSRCVRTVRDLGERLGAPRSNNALAHDALEDARAQAIDVINILALVKS